MDDILAALQLCNNSSPGLDEIKFIYLKNLPKSGLLFLVDIFNEILVLGVCPSIWKETKIVSILKPGKDANNENSYRPISLLSCIRKTFEKMLFTRLEFWAEKFEILSPTQFGFRKGKGTRDCLALLSSDIRISLEEKKYTLASFLDITGAYDNVQSFYKRHLFYVFHLFHVFHLFCHVFQMNSRFFTNNLSIFSPFSLFSKCDL